MADATVIKEFLVKLGFSTDESSSRRFLDLITNASVKVAELAAGVEAAAIGVVAAVGRMSSEMDKLYFSAQRSSGTAQGIEALGYAFAQAGMSAQQARSAVEGMAIAIRSSPGLAGMLQGLGVNTNQPMERVLQQFVERTNRFQPYVQQQLGRMFGLDPVMLMQMRRGLSGFVEEYDRMAERMGVDTNKAAEAGHYFSTEWRALGGVFDLLQQKVDLALGRRMGDIIGRFRHMLEDNAGTITAAVEHVSNVIVFFGENIVKIIMRFGQMIQDVIKWWDGLDASSKRVIATLGLMVVAWRALNIAFAMSPIGLIVTAIAALAIGILALYDDYKTFVEYGRDYSLIDWDTVLPYLREFWRLVKEVATAIRDFLLEAWKEMAVQGRAIWTQLDRIGTALQNLGLTGHIGTWNDWGAALRSVGTLLGQLGLELLTAPLIAIRDLLTIVADLLEGRFSQAWEDVKQLGADFWAEIKRVADDFWNALPDDAHKALIQLKDYFLSIFDDIKTAVTETYNFITSHLPHFGGTGGKAPAAGAYDVPGFTPMAYHPGEGGGDVVQLLRQILEALSDTLGGGGPVGGGLGGMLRQASFNTGGGFGAGVPVAGLGGMGRITASIQERANYIIDQARQTLGLSPEQAAGVAGKLMSESGLNPAAFNPAGGGHGAAGIAQWRGARQEALAKYMNDHPEMSPFQAQVGFMLQELQSSPYADALNSLRQQSTAAGANMSMFMYERGEAFSRYRGGGESEQFLRGYRPGPMYGAGGGGGDRAGAALNQTNNINIHGVNDPHAVGTEVEHAQNRANATALRNMQGAFI